MAALLLPSDKLAYEGYITCGVNDCHIKITVPAGGKLCDARFECDWKLARLLLGSMEDVEQRLSRSCDVSSFLNKLTELLDGQLKHQMCSVSPPPPRPPSYYQHLCRDIEAVGWQRMVHIDPTFQDLQIKATDRCGRQHILCLHLSAEHPLVPPHLKTELPSTVSFPWTPQSSIQDVVSAFEAELELLQAFWSAMEGLDRSLWVLEPECPGAACTYRRVVLKPNVSVVVTVVDPYKPLLPPSLKFLGPDDLVGCLKEKMQAAASAWDSSDSIPSNLQRLLQLTLPTPAQHGHEFSDECGICYSYTFGSHIPDTACQHCGKFFHHSCLIEWLGELPTSRKSFNTLFGNCPYCTKSISIKSSS